MLNQLLHTPITVEPITILIWISIIVVVIVGIYLTLVLHRILKVLKTVNLATDFVEKFRDVRSITDKLPLKKIRKVTDWMPTHKKSKK